MWTGCAGRSPRWSADGQYRSLVDPAGAGPKLILQQVSDVKAGKNRMHLDVHAADVQEEVTRLERLGATRLDSEPLYEAGTAWVRMLDPDGNDFCVCRLEG